MRKRYVFLSAVTAVVGSLLGVLSRTTTVVQAAEGADGKNARGGPDGVPVVVELFTSEGCSSCPPADDVLARLERSQPVAGARVVPLAFHVDYWDELGWPDPFAASAFTARQGTYATTGGRMYTPQAIVDGKSELVGSNAKGVERAIAEAAARPHASVDISVQRKNGFFEAAIHVGPLPKGTNVAASEARVFVALTQSRTSVAVLRGENGGRTLEHTAVVRDLETAGTIDARGGDARATLRAPRGILEEQLRIVAFAQRTNDHQIVGSATRTLAR